MVLDGLEPNSENANCSAWQTRNCIKDATRYAIVVLKTIIEIVPGYFNATERNFSSSRPDVWGFRTHFTHKKGKEAAKKRENNAKKGGKKTKRHETKQKRTKNKQTKKMQQYNK
jgi:hypothetical protein